MDQNLKNALQIVVFALAIIITFGLIAIGS
ncbi:cytochrome bd-I oxidase subunit CydH [Vibrio gallaecicus]|uniref:YnhF family membrane protein n=1 Tax=Vibrio gallaecicus TaxID=552386 RepID=A0ABV4NFF7_9VIBR